jgi:hypothetical protein
LLPQGNLSTMCVESSKKNVHLIGWRTAASAVAALLVCSAPALPARYPCPPPDGPIAIESISLSENPIRTGRTVSGTVTATCNVAAVTAAVGTFRIGVPKVAPGLFRTSVFVPLLILPGNYTLVVTAIRTDGATVHTELPVQVRW